MIKRVLLNAKNRDLFEFCSLFFGDFPDLP